MFRRGMSDSEDDGLGGGDGNGRLTQPGRSAGGPRVRNEDEGQEK